MQIGSHIHLPDVNAALEFDRAARTRLPPRHPLRHVAAVRAGRLAGTRRGRVPRGATGSRHPDQDRRRGAARWSGLTGRGTPRSTGRPSATGAPRRHRPVDPDRAGPDRRRRGGGLRRRQVDPRIHGAGRTTTRADGALDTVITNAIILDWWGIVRADIGIRDGRIVGIGHAGNPDISDGIEACHRPVDRCHLR